MLNNRVIIDNVNQYQSVLYFTSLSVQDGGAYQCSVNVISLSDYVTQADSTSNTTTLTVTSKTHNTLLYTTPSILTYRSNDWKFLSIAPASDPYDNFTLTCTASKPTIVLSDLILVWIHNGTIRNGTVSTITTSDTTTVTNTLSYSTTQLNDNGTYSCNASLYLPDETMHIIEEITAIIKCKCMHHYYDSFS